MDRDDVEEVSFPATAEGGERWEQLQRRWSDWRLVWGGALSTSCFLCLASVYTFVKFYHTTDPDPTDPPSTVIDAAYLWMFQVSVWSVMILMAILCMLAQRRISNAEEEMARMMVKQKTRLSWEVTQTRWDRFQEDERQRIIGAALQLLPLAGGVVLVAVISIASVILYQGDTADVVFAVTVTLELLLATICLLCFIHGHSYWLSNCKQTVHVKLLVDSDDEGATVRKQLVVVMGDRFATATYRYQACLRRNEGDDSVWEVFVGSYAFPVAYREEGFIRSRFASVVAKLPAGPSRSISSAA